MVAQSDVGIAISGPLLNQTYQVTHGQTVEGYLRLENSGASNCTFRFTSKVISGPLDSVIVSGPQIAGLYAPQSIVQTNWTFRICENASGLVVVRLTAIATSDSTNGSIAQASISGNVYFEIDPNSLSIDIRVIDQYGWPIENAEIELVKGFVSYVRQRTNSNGTTRFFLTQNLYTLRLFQHGSLKETATLNVTEPRLFTFTILRQVVSTNPPMTIPLIEVGLGVILGYALHYVEKYKRRHKKPREHKSTEVLEWVL